MCRRLRSAIACIAFAPGAICAAQTGSSVSSAEWVVERYLDERGLNDLLSTELERRFDGASGDERTRLAERLAGLYVEQMESAETPAERARIQSKARALVGAQGGVNSPDLTIMLDRATYVRAESLAEEWRVRFRDREALDEAVATFQTVADELDALARTAHRRVQELERQQDEGRRDDELLSRLLTDERRRRSQAFYLAGWCNTYLAEMAGVRSSAQAALRQFGWVLQASDGEPARRDKFPERLLTFEHVARSAIGVAVCYASLGQPAEAIAWIDMVEESEETPDVVRAELAARRMTVLAYTARWSELADSVDALLRDRGAGGLTSGEARLLAVLCLEGTSRSQEARTLRRTLASIGVSTLVGRGELTQTLDLARRYGESLVGERGFVGLHVRGLLAYEAARQAHLESGRTTSEPVADPAIAALFREAADSLRDSIEANDAGDHAQAVARAQTLYGVCLYMSAPAQPDPARAFVEAAKALKSASTSASTGNASESAAMAIRALEQAMARLNTPPETPGLLARFMNEFLDAFPSHPAAGAMLYRKAESAGLTNEDRVSLLLRVASNSNAYESARRKASHLLFGMWESSAPDYRDWAAGRYIDVAEPIFLIDIRNATDGDRDAGVKALARGRRLLAAMLSLSAANADRAERVLMALREGQVIASTRSDDRPRVEAELAYREAQLALARGDLALARALAERVSASGDAASELGGFIGERLLFSHAVERWRMAKRTLSPEAEIVSRARVVAEEGANLLADLEAAPGAVEPDVALGVETATAEAAYDLWSLAGENSARALGIALHRRVLEQHPGSAGFLRRMAELSESAGDRQTALECWRTLSAGLSTAEPAWFEARYRLIRLLARQDRRRAIAVIDQHAVLFPEFGPAPWGDRLRTLHEELGGR